MVRLLFLHIIFGLICSWSYAQHELVELEINPNTIEKGQSISITVKSNVDGQLDMNLPNDFIQSGAMQSGMSSSFAIVNGKQQRVRYTYQSFTGYFENSGTYEVGPVVVETKNGEIYKSKAYKVRVIERQNMISEDPSKNMNKMIFGIIEQSKKEIYEGEPIVLEGKVYSQVEVLQIEGFNSFSFEGAAESHNLSNPNQVSSSYEVIKGQNVQTFRIGKQLIFPEKIGHYPIKPFQTIILYDEPRTHYPERAKITSNTTQINIKPLPEGMPKHFIGAVGEFNISADFLNTRIDQGEVVELKIKVTGHGNLHNIKKPKIYLPKGLLFYGDPEISDSINYTSRGSEGSKTFTYFIQINKPGNIQINPITIAYFNPTTEAYESTQCKVKMLRVKSTGEEIEEIPVQEKKEKVKPIMQPYITEKTEEVQSGSNILTGWKGTMILFSPIMLGLLFGFGVRIKKQNEESSHVKKMRIQHRIDAMSALDDLSNEANNSNKLEQLSRLLIQFLAREFKVDNGEVSRLFLKAKMPSEIDPDTYEKLIFVLDELDSMKFGGSIENSDVTHLKGEVKSIIKSFEA